jgi:DNA-binding response OmpR family regulator
MQPNQRRILYVEDHDDTRELVTLILEQRNYLVTPSWSIETGLKLANEERFDLFLLDSWLPDGSGLELCRKIREFNGHTPILFYSAAAFELDKETALTSGAQAYLTKPSHLGELCDVVSSLVDNSIEAPNPPYQEWIIKQT